MTAIEDTRRRLVGEHLVPMSAPMVRATISGIKTQLLIVLKPQPPSEIAWFNLQSISLGGGRASFSRRNILHEIIDYYSPPIGLGHRIRVREDWRTTVRYEKFAPLDLPTSAPIYFEADPIEGPGEIINVMKGRLRQAQHMPLWAPRLSLEVTGIRVQRLQDISEHDAKAEGAMRHIPCKYAVSGSTVATDSFYYDEGIDGRIYEGPTAKDAFEILWGKTNGWGSWDANPWVAVYDFKFSPEKTEQSAPKMADLTTLG